MILTILKVIGIIILVLLLLIIFILALVLLIPIRYRFSAEYFDKPDVLATVRYALVGLNAQVAYGDNGLQYTVRALGGVILTNTGAKLSWLGRKIAGSGNAADDKAEVYNADNSSDDLNTEDHESQDLVNDIMNNENVSIAENAPVKSDGVIIQEDIIQDITFKETDIQENNKIDILKANHKPNKDKTSDNKTDNNRKKKNKVNNKDKKDKKDKRPLTEIIDEKLELIKEKYNDIKDKLTKLNKKKDKLIKVFKSKRFETAKVDVIKYIKQLLSVIKPKHLEGRVRFGMDDPATTGEILGGLAVALPLYEGFLDIIPDFENKVIEGLLKGYGRIRLWSIVKIALKVLVNRNLMTVIKKVKTIAEA